MKLVHTAPILTLFEYIGVLLLAVAAILAVYLLYKLLDPDLRIHAWGRFVLVTGTRCMSDRTPVPPCKHKSRTPGPGRQWRRRRSPSGLRVGRLCSLPLLFDRLRSSIDFRRGIFAKFLTVLLVFETFCVQFKFHLTVDL
jgi:hypothetical protein